LLKKASRYFHTLRYLKWDQIRYQLWYRLRDRFFPGEYPLLENNELSFQKVKMDRFPSKGSQYFSDTNTFQFLNIDHVFNDEIDWNLDEYGKLWTYHLNYFDFLMQDQLSKEDGVGLINNFLKGIESKKDGLEPYPISLRIINWVKFFSRYQHFDHKQLSHLKAHTSMLLNKLEYHLLANHLLENAFALVFGAVVFPDDIKLNSIAAELMKRELEEQILDDGAHFELSPMYHCILLERALDAYNLLKNNEHRLEGIEEILYKKIQLMLNWLVSVKFQNGEIPYVNDSVKGQALEPNKIIEYAKLLGFEGMIIDLSSSRYRKKEFDGFELFMDLGNIQPEYQPGHAHADALSFVLHYKGKPIIVDRGISTYEKNEERQCQRSTSSHNTITINKDNQSDVWGGFRVGKRSETFIESESTNEYVAQNNGYKKYGVIHSRSWQFSKDKLVLLDLTGSGSDSVSAVSHLHFHPDVKIEKIKQGFILNDELHLKIRQSEEFVQSIDYKYCEGFNKQVVAKKIKVRFVKELQMEFKA